MSSKSNSQNDDGLSCLKAVKRKSTDRPPVTSYSDVVFIGDRSGSIGSMGEAPGQALFSFIQDQQTQSRENNVVMRATIVTFDNEATTIVDNEEIDSIEMSEEKAQELMRPGNTTRLYATAIEAIAAQRKRFAYLKRQRLSRSATCTAVNTLFTDGLDNESHPLTAADLNAAVKAARADGIVCIFAGANQDAISTGTQYGYNAATCLTVSSAPAHVANALRCVSGVVARASSGRTAGFTKLERACSAPAGHDAHELDAVPGKFHRRHIAAPPSLRSRAACNYGAGSKQRSYSPLLRCNAGPPPLARQNALRTPPQSPLSPVPLPVLHRQKKQPIDTILRQ